MPIYDYLCTSCDHRADILHGINDPGPNFCPSCGEEGTMRKQFAAPAIHFKGSGWAKKDRGGSAATKAAAKSSSSDSREGDSRQSDSRQSDSRQSDSRQSDSRQSEAKDGKPSESQPSASPSSAASDTPKPSSSD